MVARIAVSAAVFSIDTPFSYRIPETLADKVLPGMRVMVPFGRGNRAAEGFVLLVADGDETGLKAVTQVLDPEPVLSEAMLHLAAFLRERYFCTMYEAARALLPAGLWYAKKVRYCLIPDYDRAALEPDSPEAALVRVLEGAKDGLEQQALEATAGPKWEKAANALLTRGVIQVRTDLRSVPEKTQELAALAVSGEEALALAVRKAKAAPMQASVLEFLARADLTSVKELCYYTGAPVATVRRLRELGLVTLTQRQILRQPEIKAEPARPMDLSPEQLSAFDGLAKQLLRPRPGVALLYGVTGSGKTAVYLALIRKALAAGKTAILLVPEIALTPQLTRLFKSQLGDQVAVLHSSLRVGERYDQWRRIRAGDARVVIGARSAVFAPAPDLGLVIVDEEQEHSYKSEQSPRYHAREVAIYRGQRENALVVLGSATPSVESMYRARTGAYSLYTLTRRYGTATLPRVTLADLKEDLLGGYSGAIGAVLRGQIERNLAAGQQTILFINRRGNSRLLMCTSCGYVPKCERCSVSLTWHSANDRLMCHYCGHSEPTPYRCPECGGVLRPVGTGTQKVQMELELLFPGVEVLRMDTDTISAVNTHEALLDRFEQQKIPILVGTQMVAKGLNLNNVTLVGVLDADMALYVDDFRAAENTFDLITQVVGRAGRGQALGRAVIQTMTPGNPVLRLAANQDYAGFYRMEIPLRELNHAPPFRDLLRVTFSSLDEHLAAEAAWRFRQALERELDTLGQPEAFSLLGPAPAAVARVNLYYRYRLTLAGHNSRPLRQRVEALMRQAAKDRKNKGVTISADVNAYD